MFDVLLLCIIPLVVNKLHLRATPLNKSMGSVRYKVRLTLFI